MVELGDIIDLINMVNNNSVYIFDEDGNVFELGEDFSDVLSQTVDSIDIDDDRVEIYVKHSMDIEIEYLY